MKDDEDVLVEEEEQTSVNTKKVNSTTNDEKTTNKTLVTPKANKVDQQFEEPVRLRILPVWYI